MILQHFAHSHFHRAAHGHTVFCSATENICIMNKMTIKHEHMHTWKPTSIHLSCIHNKPYRNTLAIQLLNYSPCSPWFTTRQLHFLSIFLFCLLQHICHKPTNLNWPSAPLWSYRAFTYKPFPGLIALQYNLHLYSPLHTNMIWRLCPW